MFQLNMYITLSTYTNSKNIYKIYVSQFNGRNIFYKKAVILTFVLYCILACYSIFNYIASIKITNWIVGIDIDDLNINITNLNHGLYSVSI